MCACVCVGVGCSIGVVGIVVESLVGRHFYLGVPTYVSLNNLISIHR